LTSALKRIEIKIGSKQNDNRRTYAESYLLTYLLTGLLSILFAQGPYTLSFDLSQFEFSIENGYDRVRGIEMSATTDKEYSLDLPLYHRTAQEDSSPFGLIGTKSMPFVADNTDKKGKHDILSRSVEEFLIDTNRVFVNARGDQGYSSIAFDGTNYLVVWADDRKFEIELGIWDIYCARMNQRGILLDSMGIFVATLNPGVEPIAIIEPAVSFDGTNYFVVWHDIRTAPGETDIVGTRITPSGIILDPAGIEISTAPGSQILPRVAFDGTNYMIVWEDLRSGATKDIYGARITPTGIVLDPSGIAISTFSGHQMIPSVAFDGTNYLVVWEDDRYANRDIFGCRVTQSGVILDPNGIPISIVPNDQKRPVITFGGLNYFVTWYDYRNYTTYVDVYGARVNPSGIVLDPEGIPISAEIYAQAFPSLSFDGLNYLVVWHDFRDLYTTYADIYCARVDQSGIVLDPAGIAISSAVGGQGRPAIAFDGRNYLTVWHDNRSMYNGDGFDIFGSRVAPSGSVLDPSGLLITIEIYAQFYPVGEFDGNNFLVTWQDFRHGTFTDIYCSGISLSGEILDHSGIPVSTARWTQKYPSVDFDGINYFVVWQDNRDFYFFPSIYGARIDKDRHVLDPNGILIASSDDEFPCEKPLIIFGGTNYFIVWSKFTGVHYDILGARVSPAGIVLDPNGIQIAHLLSNELEPALTFDGTNYFVVWEDWRDFGAHPPDIYGSRVNQSGAVLDPGGFPISEAVNSQSNPAIAFDGNNYLVVWEDDRSGVDNNDIYGTRVTPDGIVLDPEGIPIVTLPADQVRPKVSFNGSQFVVVWEDVNSGDLIGAKVSSAGMVSPIFPVSTSPGLQYEPAISHGPEDLMLVTFTGWVPQFENYRIWGKFMGEHALWTDDPLALAHNGNRHLVRKPNTQELHLVYTDGGKVIHRYSSNGGIDWTLPKISGDGKFPTITLSYDNLPLVAWTDEAGGLWYRRQIAQGVWDVLYHFYNPGLFDPKVNSPPSIAVIPSITNGVDVHIIATLMGEIQVNGVIHTVNDFWFPILQPELVILETVESCEGPMDPLFRSFPSVVRCDIDRSLHLVWVREDTVCYATKSWGQPWDNWGPQFGFDGLQSAHPFVETYGDMVYVVWQYKETPGAPEEVYKGWRQLAEPSFTHWERFTLTPNTASRYPVNASGLFTVYVDSPWPPINGSEIYYKVHPEDTPINISQTIASSLYPQSAARFTGSRTYLYTAWLDGDGPAYEIRFKKLAYIPPELLAYLTSNNGYETPSPYLIFRDSFISTWSVPVDIGYETITYQLPLEPGYRYKVKLIAYHESSGQWKEWVIIDNKQRHLIKYNAFEPETLEFWVPPSFYKDGLLEVVFDRITGDFATGGPFWVYRFEYEEELEGEEIASGGPMMQESQPLNEGSLIITPNPFANKLSIKAHLVVGNQRISFKVYDISGRLVKKLYDGMVENNFSINWAGEDENGRKVTAGVYFIAITHSNTKETFCHKVIKVE